MPIVTFPLVLTREPSSWASRGRELDPSVCVTEVCSPLYLIPRRNHAMVPSYVKGEEVC